MDLWAYHAQRFHVQAAWDANVREDARENVQPTVGIIPFRYASGQLQVALSFRHGTSRLRDVWGAAGGWVERGESIVDAAIRELCEETGYLTARFRLSLVGFEPGTTDEKPPRHYLTASFGVELPEGVHLATTEPRKHGPWTFFTIAEAIKLPLLPNFDLSLRHLERHLTK